MFKKLIGTFIEFDEKEEPEQTAAPVTSQAPPKTNPTTPASVVASVDSTVDSDIVSTITNAVLTKKTAYTTFVEASSRLEAVIPDETTRMKAAFVTITGDGRSLEQVLQALDMHASDVDGEVMRCERGLASKRATDVDNVAAEANQLAKANERLVAQIDTLQQQIAKANQDIQENTNRQRDLTHQAEQAALDISSFEQRFKRAAEFVKTSFIERKKMLASLMK